MASNLIAMASKPKSDGLPLRNVVIAIYVCMNILLAARTSSPLWGRTRTDAMLMRLLF